MENNTGKLEVVIKGQGGNPLRPHKGPFPHDAVILNNAAKPEELQMLEEYLSLTMDSEWLEMKSHADKKRLHLPIPGMDWKNSKLGDSDVPGDEEGDNGGGDDDGKGDGIGQAEARALLALRAIMKRVITMAGLPTDLLGDGGGEVNFERYVFEKVSAIKSLPGASNQKWHLDVKGHQRDTVKKKGIVLSVVLPINQGRTIGFKPGT